MLFRERMCITVVRKDPPDFSEGRTNWIFVVIQSDPNHPTKFGMQHGPFRQGPVERPLAIERVRNPAT